VRLNHAARRWLADALQCDPDAIERLTPLKGATSSSLFAVHAHGTTQGVLRVVTNEAWLAESPDLVEHEVAALDEAHRHVGIPTPRAIAAASGDVGFGAPVVLMSWLNGAVSLPARPPPAWLERLAATAVAIHRHARPRLRWKYSSWTNKTALSVPAWSTLARDRWQRAFAIARAPAPHLPEVFIHRDFHPTNVLWRDGDVTGVVDWANACRGPAAVDVAHCRTNLTAMYGTDVADAFLGAYMRLAGRLDYQPYWDLDSMLDWVSSGPSFYAPWGEFGLATIPREKLRQRFDEHLASILRAAEK
jgi:Ser/Thr protein kinase RdoA (MazF antagonist)